MIENIYSKEINFSILKIHSSILHFLPILRFHEIILIKTNDKKLYTLDFTPINQKESTTLFNLLIGNNVNANIRIRNIDIFKNDILKNVINNVVFRKIHSQFALLPVESSIDISELKIIELWNNMNNISDKDSEILSELTFNKIKNKSLKLFIKKSIVNWPNKMNLYNCNCIHYGNYVYKNYLDILNSTI
jgi:hypothetical protein